MEHQMEKKMENEMETVIMGLIGCVLRLYIGVISGLYRDNGKTWKP